MGHDAAASRYQLLHVSPILHGEAHHELQHLALTLLLCCCFLLLRHGLNQQAQLRAAQEAHTLVADLQAQQAAAQGVSGLAHVIHNTHGARNALTPVSNNCRTL